MLTSQQHCCCQYWTLLPSFSTGWSRISASELVTTLSFLLLVMVRPSSFSIANTFLSEISLTSQAWQSHCTVCVSIFSNVAVDYSVLLMKVFWFVSRHLSCWLILHQIATFHTSPLRKQLQLLLSITCSHDALQRFNFMKPCHLPLPSRHHQSLSRTTSQFLSMMSPSLPIPLLMFTTLMCLCLPSRLLHFALLLLFPLTISLHCQSSFNH
jgi:hypothetical protein